MTTIIGLQWGWGCEIAADQPSGCKKSAYCLAEAVAAFFVQKIADC